MYIWILAYLLLFEAKTVSGLKCLSCTDISHPQLCKQTVQCGQGEACGISKFLTSGGEIKYTLNCVAHTWCQTHVAQNTERGVVKRDNLMLCYNCCDKDLCNSGGCGEKDYKTLNKTICYNCNNAANRHCSTIEICDDNEICFIHEIRDFIGTHFNSGCRRRNLCNALGLDPQAVGRKKRYPQVVGRHKREGLCFKCCEGSLCNDDCTGHCIDQPECQTLMTEYSNICTDKLVAPRICPQTCGLCQAQSTHNVLPSNCVDGSANCEYLNNQYEICNNRKTVEDLACYKTCKVCEYTAAITNSTTKTTVIKTTTTTSTQNSVSMTTTTTITQKPDCRSEWFFMGGSCKLLLSPARTWMEANAECQKQGGFLLTIQDNTEQNIIDKYLTYYNVMSGIFWIGLRKHNDGHWHWEENGQIDSFSNWLPYYTSDNANGDCATYGSRWSYYWKASNCSSTHNAICEY